jgi:hypothetical protein
MGKLKDMFDGQIKEARNYEKKKIWLRSEPKFINYNITYQQIREIGIDRFNLCVTNLLNIEDKSKITTIIDKVDKKGFITSIKCPVCRETIELNKHWNVYICSNPTHGRIVFEISNIECDKPQKVCELENGDEEHY